MFDNILNAECWLEEYLDPSEPRAVSNRALKLLKSSASREDVLSIIEKAYERGPQFAKILADYACYCLALGFRGHSKFYTHAAHIAAPSNPIIAGLTYKLRCLLQDQSTGKELFEAALTPDSIKAFRKVCESIREKGKFPGSYFEAASDSFLQSQERSETWMWQRW